MGEKQAWIMIYLLFAIWLAIAGVGCQLVVIGDKM